MELRALLLRATTSDDVVARTREAAAATVVADVDDVLRLAGHPDAEVRRALAMVLANLPGGHGLAAWVDVCAALDIAPHRAGEVMAAAEARLADDAAALAELRQNSALAVMVGLLDPTGEGAR